MASILILFQIGLHLLVLAVFFVPFTESSLWLCGGSYFVRMLAITAGFHRGLSHRSYKTSRLFQFFLAFIGCSAYQKGPCEWVANHRRHHAHTDKPGDPHSPIPPPPGNNFWHAHMFWIRKNKKDLSNVADLTKYWELRLLDRFHWFPGLCLLLLCYAIDGASGMAWGFVVSTIALYHGTFCVNSVCHLWGRRRYETPDQSRNNALVALLTLGEGWHNNHHHYQRAERQGRVWWEIDIAHYFLWLAEQAGLIWDRRKPPLETATKAPKKEEPVMAN